LAKPVGLFWGPYGATHLGLAAKYATSVYTGMRAGEVAGLKWPMVATGV